MHVDGRPTEGRMRLVFDGDGLTGLGCILRLVKAMIDVAFYFHEARTERILLRGLSMDFLRHDRVDTTDCSRTNCCTEDLTSCQLCRDTQNHFRLYENCVEALSRDTGSKVGT